MIDLVDPMPFQEALNYLRRKKAVGATMDTAQWSKVPTAIKIHGMFSAGLTSVRVASRMQTYIDDFLAQDIDMNERGEELFSSQGRSEFVSKFRSMMMDEGFGKVLPDGTIDPHINDNDLRDLRSCRRLQLIFDTQVEQANSYGQYLESQDEDILDIWPCQRFVRVRPVLSPRPYHDTALGEIRRKDDLDFWVGLNRDFKVPWGPWGFNSGCGTEDVDRIEAEAAGVIKPNDKVRPIVKDFNDGLQAELDNLNDDDKHYLANLLHNIAVMDGDNLTLIDNYGQQPISAPGGDRDLRPGDKDNQSQDNDSGGRADRQKPNEDGLGFPIFDAQVASRPLQESWGVEEPEIKPIIDTAAAQITAVINGRKPLYIEPFPETAFTAMRDNLPNGVGALYDGEHVIIYNKQEASRTLGVPMSDLSDSVRQAVRNGDSGNLLGYGASSLSDRPAYLVKIFNGPELVCGFISSGDYTTAERYAMMRIQDFLDTADRPAAYSFNLQYLPKP